MQQKNYFYYVILLLIPPAVVLKSRFVTQDNLYMIVPLAIAYLCYFFCLMLFMQIKGKRYKIPIAIGASKYMINYISRGLDGKENVKQLKEQILRCPYFFAGRNMGIFRLPLF